MTEQNNPPAWGDQPTQPQQAQEGWPPPPPTSDYAMAPAPTGYPVQAYAPQSGPIGKVRSTGTCFLLTIVTFGLYSLYWFYATHDEMKRHTGNGLGGGVALLIGFLLSIVMYFLTPSEIKAMYERRGMRSPVEGTTGLWALLLGWFFLVGMIVWFVKVNEALNDYWRSQGAA